MRGYGDVVPLGASLTPLRGTDSIIWNVKFRNGELKRFRLPIRTTPWGSIEPYIGLASPEAGELKKPGLCGQDRYLGVPELPTIRAA
jgi:adenylylsulfate reductase subunit B